MTKSIEAQAEEYADQMASGGKWTASHHDTKQAFIAGAKARDAQWSAVVNIFKSQDRLKGYPTGIEWQQLITKANQLLKEMGIKNE